MSENRGKHRQAAVIFSLASAQATQIRVICSVHRGSALLELITQLLTERAIDIADDELKNLKQYQDSSISIEIGITVKSLIALTKLASCYSHEMTSANFNDDFQAIIGRPIRPQEISKIEMRTHNRRSVQRRHTDQDGE